MKPSIVYIAMFAEVKGIKFFETLVPTGVVGLSGVIVVHHGAAYAHFAKK